MKLTTKITSILSLLVSLTLNAQTNDSFIHNGLTRDFVYYKPSSWTPSESLPLLIVLHGVTQTGSGIMNITGFNSIAESDNFIVCYPDGINASWNADMDIINSQVDDLGFIEELSIYMQNNLNTDPTKQYLTGISNGAFMCHKILCESTQCYAGAATVAGTMSHSVSQNCNPQNNTDILHIHGTLDAVVSYNGSPSTGISVDELMDTWKSFYNCNETPNIDQMPNINILDLSYAERHRYLNCDNAELEHIKVIGGGHQWPGILTIWGGVGTINMDFYSPQIIWDFLNGKECSQLNEIKQADNNNSKKLVKIIDMMGRETKFKTNTPLILMYNDGTKEKIIQLD